MKTRLNYRTRGAVPLDAESILDIDRKCHGEYGVTADDLDWMMNSPSEFVIRVCECGGVPFGFAVWMLKKRPSRAMILRMSVDPRFRQMGVAGQLLQPLDWCLNAEIIETVVADVPEVSVEAQLCLRSLGYVCIHIGSDSRFGGCQSYRFVKSKSRIKPPIRFGQNRVAQFYHPAKGESHASPQSKSR